MGRYIMAFDTETNGLPRAYNRGESCVDSWPRMVQIGWVLAHENGDPVIQRESLIRPDNWTIDAGTQLVHGISTDDCIRNGADLGDELFMFCAAASRSQVLISHNMAFDWPVIHCESLRAKFELASHMPQRVCTMEMGVDICKIRGQYAGYKRPKLSELHRTLFGEDFDGAHSALADAKAALRCYVAIRGRGVLI